MGCGCLDWVQKLRSQKGLQKTEMGLRDGYKSCHMCVCGNVVLVHVSD